MKTYVYHLIKYTKLFSFSTYHGLRGLKTVGLYIDRNEEKRVACKGHGFIALLYCLYASASKHEIIIELYNEGKGFIYRMGQPVVSQFY